MPARHIFLRCADLLIVMGLFALMPAAADALYIPGVQRQLPGQYQMLSTDNIDTRNSIQKQQASASSVSSIVYQSKTLNLQFSYPSTWFLLDSVKFIALWLNNKNNTSGVTSDSAVYIRVDPFLVPADYTATQLDNYFLSFMTLSDHTGPLEDFFAPEFSLISASGTTLLGHPARIYTYTAQIESVPTKLTLILATMNKQIYSVYYHSGVGTFDKDRSAFDEIAGSLQGLAMSSAASSLSSVNSTTGASHISFTDVPASNPSHDAVESLVSSGIVSGYSDGTFRPDGLMNRAELVKILIAGLHPTEVRGEMKCFPDVQNTWFSQYVCAAKRLGWVAGYSDGGFRPGNTLTDAEALKMIVSSINSSSSSASSATGSAWYTPFVEKATSMGMLQNESFTAGAKLTRGQAAIWIARALQAM